MGFLSKIGSSLGIGAVAPSLGLSVIEQVGAKYNADMQGHLMDRQADQNRSLAFDTALVNEGISQRAFERQKAWDLEMWDKDKAYQDDLWTRQNEYNAPAAQMQRLKEAGLNPMLMYGQGTPGNATVIPTADRPSSKLTVPVMDTPRRDAVYTKVGQGLGSDIMEGILKYFQIRNIDLENQIKDKERALVSQRTRKAGLDADLAEYELGLTKKSGVSSRDWNLLRLGGRIMNWLRTRDWDRSNEAMERGESRIYPLRIGGD